MRPSGRCRGCCDIFPSGRSTSASKQVVWISKGNIKFMEVKICMWMETIALHKSNLAAASNLWVSTFYRSMVFYCWLDCESTCFLVRNVLTWLIVIVIQSSITIGNLYLRCILWWLSRVDRWRSVCSGVSLTHFAQSWREFPQRNSRRWSPWWWRKKTELRKCMNAKKARKAGEYF